LPKGVEFTKDTTKIVAEVLDICRARMKALGDRPATPGS